MIKTIEDTSGTKKRMTIEIPVEAMEQEIGKTLAHIRKNASFPGFRQGKAPMSLVEKKYGKTAEGEAIEKIIPQYYSDAIAQSKLKPIANPSLEGSLDFNRGAPLTLTFNVEVRPEIAGVKYDGLTVTDVPTEVGDEDIDRTMDRIRQDKASYEPTDEPAADGDVVIMDYTTKEDEKPFEGEVYKIGTSIMPEEFTSNLTGKKKGDKAEFDATFPEDYYSKELAGQKRSFSVELKEVKKMVQPELDDEFAKDLEFESLEDMKKHVAERLEESRKATITKMQKAEILASLVEAHEFEAPESLVAGELEKMLAEARGQAQGQQLDEAKLKEEYSKNAERNVKASLLIQEIGEKEGVEVTEEEMNERVVALAQSVNMTPENIVKYYVSKDGSLDGLSQSVFEDKVMEMLVGRAERVKPKEGSGKDKKGSKEGGK